MQFQFLNIFAYKLFRSLNFSDFDYFLCEYCNPLWKKSPLFPSKPPLNDEVLSSLPFWKIWLGAQREGWTLRYLGNTMPLSIYKKATLHVSVYQEAYCISLFWFILYFVHLLLLSLLSCSLFKVILILALDMNMLKIH